MIEKVPPPPPQIKTCSKKVIFTFGVVLPFPLKSGLTYSPSPKKPAY